MSTTTDLNTLVINYLTEAQYEAAVQGGTIDPDQLYLTPDAGGGSVVTDVEVDGVSVVTAGVASVDLTGKSDVGHTHTKTDITDFPSLATVATSGSYSDLSNKPTIPTITDTYSGTSSNGMSGKAVKSAIDALDGTITGSAGSSKTLTAFSQTDGKVSATFDSISITKSQVSDFPTDYVEEQGTSGIWTYRKWNSGVAECWGSTTVALNINQSYGAMYWATFDQALPSGLFTSVTSAVATRGATSGSANGLVGISFHDVSTTTLGAYVYDSVAASDTWGFSFEVKGRWK